MVAAVQGLDRRITGIWRIFLSETGDKAPLEKAKLGLGQAGGGAVRLGPVAAKIAVTEGIETALSVASAEPALTVWAALSTSGMRALRLPAETRHVLICADQGPAGQQAAEVAAWRFQKEGRWAVIALPGGPEAPKGFDFNDLIVGAA